jgi:hypothetical protein
MENFRIEKTNYGLKITFMCNRIDGKLIPLDIKDFEEFGKYSQMFLKGIKKPFQVFVIAKDVEITDEGIKALAQGQRFYAESGMNKSFVVHNNMIMSIKWMSAGQLAGIKATEKYRNLAHYKNVNDAETDAIKYFNIG